jgi:hypothetical protein
MILRSLLSCVLLLGSTVHAQTTAPIEIQRCLVIGPLGRAARQSALVDPIEATIVAGKWQAPHDGDELVGADGKASRWRSIMRTTDVPTVPSPARPTLKGETMRCPGLEGA